ncbi:hypothetical protein WDC_0587 [Paucilactobacillus wasatchensis]|uniref:Uncharacterized protein n=1 Tax=Paucilactobacillus wasatchensis TaxID=1335616 RepID=A0A0D1AAU6_9LACO|nr:hypothetical protein WDC_0587 [Paucilactobacillus wasatchensis]
MVSTGTEGDGDLKPAGIFTVSADKVAKVQLQGLLVQY